MRVFRVVKKAEKKTVFEKIFSGYKELLLLCNRMVKDARTCYFPELVSAHQHNSRLLFKIVDQSVNPALSHASADCDAVWDKSLLCCKGGVNKAWYSNLFRY